MGWKSHWQKCSVISSHVINQALRFPRRTSEVWVMSQGNSYSNYGRESDTGIFFYESIIYFANSSSVSASYSCLACTVDSAIVLCDICHPDMTVGVPDSFVCEHSLPESLAVLYPMRPIGSARPCRTWIPSSAADSVLSTRADFDTPLLTQNGHNSERVKSSDYPSACSTSENTEWISR
jgi:hypothetical protein